MRPRQFHPPLQLRPPMLTRRPLSALHRPASLLPPVVWWTVYHYWFGSIAPRWVHALVAIALLLLWLYRIVDMLNAPRPLRMYVDTAGFVRGNRDDG